MAPPVPPAVARVRSEAAWDGRGKGEGKSRETLHEGSSSESSGSADADRSQAAIPPASRSSLASSSSRHSRWTGKRAPTVDSSSRPLGLLGIPLPNSDDSIPDEGGSVLSSESLEANPPASPVAPMIAPSPGATYSRGGSTRSGPSTKGGDPADGAAFVSEASFRDIVDDLTLQNQELRARLKQFESAKVPKNLRKERLFEVRFFESLPKAQRREIEAFLTDYVQTISTNSNDTSGTSSSRAFCTTDEPSDEPSNEPATSAPDQTESTSSAGATLRSLRSSEKKALARKAAQAGWGADVISAGSVHGSQSGSGSRSGSGSGKANGGRSSRRRGSGSPTNARCVPHVKQSQESLTVPTSPSTNDLDPPPLLRRPADVFPTERDVLAAPSFSGIEPRSYTGTGHEMRISDPTAKNRKRTRPASSHDDGLAMADRNFDGPERLRLALSTRDSFDAHASPDPETLEHLIVEMIERLFLGSLPTEHHSSSSPDSSPPTNPLQSDPFPLPAHSSTNTQYLRTMITSDEAHTHGGWLYLNLISTMAALHRLNVSVSTIRHALRTKSQLIEVSEEGNKIRWRGPEKKPSRKQKNGVEEAEKAFDMDGMEDNDIEASRMHVDGDSRSASSTGSERGGGGDSLFDDRPARFGNNTHPSTAAASTAPTSLNPSGSKNGTGGSSSNGTHFRCGQRQREVAASVSSNASELHQLRSVPLSGSALRNSIEEVGSPAQLDGDGAVEALGSSASVQVPHRLHYIPLFARRTDPTLDPDNDSPSSDSAHVDSSDDAGESQRPGKRRKIYEGGIVFFASDLFCSDLAGDFGVRTKLQLEAGPRRRALGDSVSPEPMDVDELTSRRSESDFFGFSSRSSAVDGSKASDDNAAGDWSSSPVESDESDSEDVVLKIMGAEPLPEWSPRESYLGAPYPPLRLSATNASTASDHFTIQTTLLFPSLTSRLSTSPPRNLLRRYELGPLALSAAPRASPRSPLLPSPAFISSKTLYHHPAVCERPPRVRMSISSDTSDSEDSSSDQHGAGGERVRSALSSSSGRRRRQHSLRDQLAGRGRAPGYYDYPTSLGMPLNKWAPDAKRVSESEERLTEERLSELWPPRTGTPTPTATGTGESMSLITLD
ncbi:hypothetical protein JCM21900_005178 [Sporobolomyces salmonicolor]